MEAKVCVCEEVLPFRGTVVRLFPGLTPETVAQTCETLWNSGWVWLPVKLNLRCQLHVSLLPLLRLGRLHGVTSRLLIIFSQRRAEKAVTRHSPAPLCLNPLEKKKPKTKNPTIRRGFCDFWSSNYCHLNSFPSCLRAVKSAVRHRTEPNVLSRRMFRLFGTGVWQK